MTATRVFGGISSSGPTGATTTHVPMADRPAADVQGHWLLARLGKRVLRPGGIGLTRRLLSAATLEHAAVVEFAPGLGRTAALIMARRPESYVGVDADPQAAAFVRQVVGVRGSLAVAQASASGLPAEAADVVIGEAMLTMQSASGKQAIVTEAARLLRPGGRYLIHELALRDEDGHTAGEEVRAGLARSLHVNARPLPVAEWSDLLAAAGFEVAQVHTAPLALLEAHRVLADEGLRGTLRFARNLARDADALRRVRAMGATLRANKRSLVAVGIVARKPASAASSA